MPESRTVEIPSPAGYSVHRTLQGPDAVLQPPGSAVAPLSIERLLT